MKVPLMMTIRTPGGKKRRILQALGSIAVMGLGGLANAAGRSVWDWLMITL
ncbi:hypothetical protein [Streptomyces sp. SS]|uniref:hypothetical protein n=1 Tax=Streptomyces sp. SS TaxID=260742 RepID=UPI00031779C6|nr:hypothetical protein [Streptomyces sp. SS]